MRVGRSSHAKPPKSADYLACGNVRPDHADTERVRRPPHSMLIDTPFFLVGCERSGTTLLRLMLDHHPKIAFNGESEMVITQIAEDGTYPDIKRYHEWLRNDRVFRHHSYRIDESLGYVELVNDLLNQKRIRAQKEIVGATVHVQFCKLRRVWPRSKFIYIYRDGRDVAHSVMRMGWAGNTYVASDWWLRAEREWNRLRETLSDDYWIEVRYEDLIANARSALERICAFVGVEYSEKMFDYVRTSTYEAPDPGLMYQWKTRLDKVDLQRLEDKLGDQLVSRGYALSGMQRISVPALTRRYLSLHSRVGAYVFRIRRFGAVLALQETLSRRLGLREAHLRAMSRINRVINANLK